MGDIPNLKNLHRELINSGLVQLHVSGIGLDSFDFDDTGEPNSAFDARSADTDIPARDAADEDEILTLNGVRLSTVHPINRITLGRRRSYAFAPPDIDLAFSAQLSKTGVDRYIEIGSMDDNGILQLYTYKITYKAADNTTKSVLFSGWLHQYNIVRPDNVQESTAMIDGMIRILDLKVPTPE